MQLHNIKRDSFFIELFIKFLEVQQLKSTIVYWDDQVHLRNRVFHIRTEMPIVAFSSLYVKAKKSSNKMLPPVGIEPRP